MNSKSPASPKNPAFNIRRFVLTLVLVMVVGGIVAIIALGKNGAGIGAAPAATGTVAEQSTPATPADTQATTSSAATAASAPTAAPATPSSDERPWTANAPGSPSASATAIGSVDPESARFALVLVPQGAGIKEIIFSDLWRSAADAEHARAGAPSPEGRYSITTPGTLAGFTVPLLGARCIDVDGRKIDVSGGVWKETAPGTFVTEISDGTGALQMRATRRWVVDAGSYDIRCEQRVENLSGSPHVVRWVQFGPVDLQRDQNDSVDCRRFQSGYLMSAERDPAQETVIVHGAMIEHSKLLTQITAENYAVWPDAHQQAERYGLSWFGATNRYFALAIHAPYAQPSSPSKAIAPAVATIQAQAGDGMHHGEPEQVIFTTCTSGAVTIAPGAGASFDMGVFAGPLERSLLSNSQPFAALNMHGLILYLMSGCCSFCTFSWLADLLVWFLSFLHDRVVFDWGLAIIVLVIVVRSILHPLTRRAQISMQRVTKQMASVKPELEALQKRYKEDPKKLQEETIRLYRERGINPLGCAGGMLPTFLQMPIWIALYAVLYFAFELRQQPAFFGVFQKMGGWPFLGDLSAQDRFIPLPFEVNLWIVHLTSINLIPVLMGVVFFIQQKYQAPPPTANMTPEQEQQQKMMKWMMVFLFPIMLYGAPSGLTLYIATSTLVGIYESMRVRKEIEKMDFSKPRAAKDNWLSKAYATAMKRAQAAQQQKTGKQAPSKKFRDR
jgi:YidC/Oxa1 family membrane protein insertase